MTTTSDVCVVVVAHGDRSGFSTTADSLLRDGLGKLVIVDNGVTTQARQDYAALAARWKKAVVVAPQPTNRGSAGGYAAGLSWAATSSGCRFVWLLDDDAEPEGDALVTLLRRYEECAGATPTALVAQRVAHQDHRALAAGWSVKKVFPARGSFLNIDLQQRLIRILSREHKLATPDCPLLLPYAPWGGLFLACQDLSWAGLPREELFLYEDDTDFTHRFVGLGGRLLFVPTSRIRDSAESWYRVAPGGSGLSKYLLSPMELQLYYAVRNRVAFERHQWRQGASRYFVNKSVVMLGLRINSRRLHVPARYELIRRAVADGEAGRLGRSFEQGRPT